MNVEDKLDRLLVLQEQEIDTAVHPPLKPEYLDIIDVTKILKVKKTSINGFGRESSLSQSQWTFVVFT